ncbi:unnamed protein product [Ceratitis capitata]|uniref:(Mediterranean fruit fly) hypothetical protein n=1 Tax=Ceratitis capitata TaxID=7213 RepID=A0A811UM67_CERCA|nr:unnamed protein product [Ceratitis capitata]
MSVCVCVCILIFTAEYKNKKDRRIEQPTQLQLYDVQVVQFYPYAVPPRQYTTPQPTRRPSNILNGSRHGATRWAPTRYTKAYSAMLIHKPTHLHVAVQLIIGGGGDEEEKTRLNIEIR